LAHDLEHMALSAGIVVHRAKMGLMMEIHKQPNIGIADVTVIPPGWKRELWEWLLAVAAITIGVWFFCTVGQAFFGAVIGIMWLVR